MPLRDSYSNSPNSGKILSKFLLLRLNIETSNLELEYYSFLRNFKVSSSFYFFNSSIKYSLFSIVVVSNIAAIFYNNNNSSAYGIKICNLSPRHLHLELIISTKPIGIKVVGNLILMFLNVFLNKA